ncbi:MAG: mechanosensitive ion channel [Bacteroidota bacterium]|nr:mechanosensitive ion channel [Bacteroidota bacterium]
MKYMNALSTTVGFDDKIKEVLLNWGLSNRITCYIADFSTLIAVLIFSIIVYYIVKAIINHVLRKIVLRSPSKWDDYLYEEKVFTRLGLLIPALILEVSLRPAIAAYPKTIHFLDVALGIYSAFVIIIVAISFLNAIYKIYGDYDVADKKPIKGYVQIGKIFVYVIGSIIIISMLIGQSPITLLAGLGAISAVLLLIFKDSILGFVAGVQISSNHLLHLGDWITMEKYNVDGVVTDISLVTVKVQNFDNSVSAVPTYSFISESFQNWREQLQNGGRRMKRSLLIDILSIRQADKELKSRIREKYSLPVLQDNASEGMTNLGLFREVMTDYLKKQPEVNLGMTCLIRQLEATDHGLPLEFYVFLKIDNYIAYENYVSGLFEYIFSILPDFGLRIYQRTSVIQTENR